MVFIISKVRHEFVVESFMKNNNRIVALYSSYSTTLFFRVGVQKKRDRKEIGSHHIPNHFSQI